MLYMNRTTNVTGDGGLRAKVQIADRRHEEW